MKYPTKKVFDSMYLSFKTSTKTAIILLCLLCFSFQSCVSQEEKNKNENKEIYTFKRGNPNGIGKIYQGREIARVMGYQGMAWLNRPEREKEENVSALIKNMAIQPEDVIADIGAGSGYHVFKMAPLAKEGQVYAVDIQPEMLEEIKRQSQEQKVENVQLVLGSEKSPNLPENTIDKILMVDVYHEFSFPYEMLMEINLSLKEGGKVYLIEYRAEDPKIPIKPIHKMTEKQAVKEFELAGFKLAENIENLPWQHCMVFEKR